MIKEISGLAKLSSDKYSLTTRQMYSTSRSQDKSWIAEVLGLDQKYGFARQFVNRIRDSQSTKVDQSQTFSPLVSNKVYEYRKIARPKESSYSYMKIDGGESGFFTITGGELVELEREDVLRYLANLEST